MSQLNPETPNEDLNASESRKRQRTEADPDSAAKEDTTASATTEQPAKRQKTIDTLFFGARKPSASTSANKGLPKLNAIPFSMGSYVDSLSDEEKSLLKLECEVMGKSWLKVLKDEIRKPYFLSLKRFLLSQGVRSTDDTPPTVKVYPPPRCIYSWSQTPLGKVKVVILGQDPYHGPGQAHGLCFSVMKGVTVPPSLRNIFAEIKAEYPDFKVPNHGNLSAWAESGVLLLNSALTVEAGRPNSHAEKGWEKFTDSVIDIVDKYGGANLPSGANKEATGFGRGVVFMAWGVHAGKRVARLSKTKHLILTSAHPSPHSFDKGFSGNGHFKKANVWLENKYGGDSKVDWCSLD
ncbi:uracil-DNA glycosylase [Panaeolus papilionaceus]|nr:uracil-DNA glycosylase [Panaeolus papilionaceus]